MKKTSRIFKFLLIIFVMTTLNINICYGKEKNIKTDIVKEDDNITLRLLANDDINLYGFRGVFDYDAKILSFDGCESDIFKISLKNNVLLLEGINGYSNSVVATCNFSVIDYKDTTTININDISLSNGLKVIYNENVSVNIDLDLNYDADVDKEPDKNPTTNGTFVIIPFIILIICVAIILIINKKYSLFSYLIIFTIIISPAISFAINTNDFDVTDDQLREIRNLLLKKKIDDNYDDFDFDKDKKLTINDLILGLISFDNNAGSENPGNDDVENYKVNIKYSVNGGNVTDDSAWTTDTKGTIYKNNKLYSESINYGTNTATGGLLDYNDFISRVGYNAANESEWKCLSGCTVEGKVFSQTALYKDSDFCDASKSDCTVELGVNWKKNKVLINYNVNGGIISSNSSNNSWTVKDGLIYRDSSLYETKVEYGKQMENKGIINYNNPEWLNIKKTGYNVADGYEWKCLSGCTTEGKIFDQDVLYKDSDFCDAKKTDCNVTIGVNWKPITYTVKYDANSGTGTMSNSNHTYDEEKALSANSFSREGYTFKGWATSKTGKVVYTDKKKVENLTGTNKEIVTLYAVWEPYSVTIKYSLNGGSFGTSTGGYKWTSDSSGIISKNGNILTHVINYGDKLNSSGLYNYNNEEVLNIVKTGYTTSKGAEWKCLSGCSNSGATYDHLAVYSYSDFCDLSKGDCTVVLGVNWKPITYTIKYNANGGTGTMSNSNHTYDEEKALSENKFSRTGYKFKGWATSETGTVVHTDKKKVKNLTSTNNGSVTLYAIWEPYSVTIKYSLNGGNFGTSTGGYNWTSDSSGIISKNGTILTSTINYGAALTTSGLFNYNNTSVLNIVRTGYTTPDGAEWKCLSGCTKDGTTYSHDAVYNSSNFCDASNGNCTVVLGVNWEKEEDDVPSDITPPTISSCSAIINDNKTEFTINTSDNDIDKYVIKGETFYSRNDDFVEHVINVDTLTKKNYVVDKVIEKPKITAYDKSGNHSDISCSWYYKQITPKGTENIKYNDSKETLKVWTELTERASRTGFYTTHIWVKDAYSQLKTHVPDNYGAERKTANALLTDAIQDYNLQNKLAVAVNASGFVVAGTWGQSYYDANPKFNNTSTSPLVISNGKVIRDFTNGDEKLPSACSPSIYGLNKYGFLTDTKFPCGSNVSANAAITKKIKDDGILNTFDFKPVLVKNGELKATDTTQNIRQAFCQIDKNNFVFVTDIYHEPRNGFAHTEMATYMLSLGCQIGYNLDGGGSTSLIYKKPNETNTTVITTSNRQITDILFFHE